MMQREMREEDNEKMGNEECVVCFVCMYVCMYVCLCMYEEGKEDFRFVQVNKVGRFLLGCTYSSYFLTPPSSSLFQRYSS